MTRSHSLICVVRRLGLVVNKKHPVCSHSAEFLRSHSATGEEKDKEPLQKSSSQTAVSVAAKHSGDPDDSPEEHSTLVSNHASTALGTDSFALGTDSFEPTGELLNTDAANSQELDAVASDMDTLPGLANSGMQDLLKAIAAGRQVAAAAEPRPDLLELAQDLNEQTAAREAQDQAADQTAPTPVEAEQPRPAHQRLLHPKYGYAILGGVNPEARVAKYSETLGQMPRLHPSRVFQPGDTYTPEDLNLFATTTSADSRTPRERQFPGEEEVNMYADYKNIAFLEKFVSEGGLILSRRETKLPRALHKRVERSIKLARMMGLMAHEARLDKMWLRKHHHDQVKSELTRVEDVIVDVA